MSRPVSLWGVDPIARFLPCSRPRPISCRGLRRWLEVEGVVTEVVAGENETGYSREEKSREIYVRESSCDDLTIEWCAQSQSLQRRTEALRGYGFSAAPARTCCCCCSSLSAM